METNLLQSMGPTIGIAGACLILFVLIVKGILKKRVQDSMNKQHRYRLLNLTLIFGAIIAVIGLALYALEPEKENATSKAPTPTCPAYTIEGKLIEQIAGGPVHMRNVQVAIEINKFGSEEVFVANGNFKIPNVRLDRSISDAVIIVSSNGKVLYEKSITLPVPSPGTCEISVGRITLIKEQSLQKDYRYAEKRK